MVHFKKNVHQFEKKILFQNFLPGGAKTPRKLDGSFPAGLPKILTEGRLHRVKVGDALTLACDVRNLGPMVLMWKKGHRVLTAGAIVVKRDKRIELDGTNVKISSKNYALGGSGCGSVGRAVASDTTDPRFESRHRQTLIKHLFSVNCVEKTKIKKKEAGNGPFF